MKVEPAKVGNEEPDAVIDTGNDQPSLYNGDRPTDQAEELRRLQEEVELWKQRYSTLQGKYDAEVPRLYDEINELRETVESLKTNEPATPPDTLDVESFMRDYPDIYNAVRGMIIREMREMKEEISSKVSEVEKKSTDALTARFLSELTDLVPDWETLNTNPDFIAWLQKIDKYSRKSRHDLLKEAVNDLDAKGASQFFLDYKREKGIPDGMTAPNVSSRKEDIRSETGKIYSQEEVRKFFDDLSRGRLQGVPPEKIRELEYEYLRAMSEGRVR